MDQTKLNTITGKSPLRLLFGLLRNHIIILLILWLMSTGWPKIKYPLIIFCVVYGFMAISLLLAKLRPTLRAQKLYKQISNVMLADRFSPDFYFHRSNLMKYGQYFLIDSKKDMILINGLLKKVSHLLTISTGIESRRGYIQFVFSRGEDPVQKVYFTNEAFLSEKERLQNFLNNECNCTPKRGGAK